MFIQQAALLLTRDRLENVVAEIDKLLTGNIPLLRELATKHVTEENKQ